MGRWHLPARLFLNKSPQDPCPSRTYSGISKYISLPYMPGVFQTTSSMLYLCGSFCCAVSLMVGTQCPITLLCLPQPCLLIFKVLVLSPLMVRTYEISSLWFFKAKCCEDSSSRASSLCLGCLVWASVSLLPLCPRHPSLLWKVPWVHLASDYISVLLPSWIWPLLYS